MLIPYAVDVPLDQWDDLSWKDVQEDFTAGNYIGLTDDLDRVAPADPGDQGVAWHSGSDAASLAYILFQDPMMVAIHAQEMLKQR